MAVVLDALAARVMNTIMDMGEDKIRMLLGVSKEINKLQGNVEPLRNLLTDAERRRITDKTVQAWVTKLKNAMYEAQDILDLCQLEAMDRQDKQHSSGLCFRLREKLPFLGCLGDKLQGILQPFLFCVQNPGFANEVGSRIKNLNDELINIRNGGAGFNFSIDLGSYKERGRPLTSSAHPRRENAQFIESDLVGDQIKKNAEDLVQKLITDHDSSSSAIKVVSIVGMGGIGKSTLAKKVLAIETIKEEFEIKIWLSVTQQFAAVDLLRTAISQAGGKPGEEKDETILAQALTDVLSKRKFLLILDDVWTVEAWDRMLRVPVLKAGCEQPRSRVLVTTRMEDIVRSMGASIVRVNRLNDEDAWCLLKKQLPLPQVGVESDFNDLKDIGMKIVKKCDGLPLAIKVMGGLLSTRYPNEREWEIILHKNIGWQEDRSQDELNYSVSLSYDDLSPVLKQCFLYYSLLPKGSGFAENRVISMWISEGFVQHSGRLEPDQLDLQEIGDEYHRELVARNLLEPDDTNNNIWEYTLHDVVRLFAQYMAKEEAFVVHKDQADIRNLLLGNKKVCRLSVKLTHSELEWTILEKQERVRTLLLIDCKIKPGGSLANFANLRVLDISSEESDWLVDTLGNLRHLRYLSLSKTNISRLPDDIHKMRFLEHIELNCCKKLEKLPSNITKLACLRYLNLNGSNVHVIPRGFGGLTNLRFVGGFPAKMDGDWCTLQELEALSHLRRLSVISLENVPRSSVAKRARIGNKKNLEYLDLSCYKDDEEEEDEVREIGVEQQERIEAVFDELCPPPKLETLQIGGYFGRRLPNWLQSPVATTFKSLKHIGLNHITYCTRLPDGLCRDGGVAFPNLRIIELDTLTLLEYVENFPSVVELKVYSCPELKRICGLSKLRTLDINNCPKLKLLEGVPVLDSLELDWEHWEVAGPDARCTPKGHQAQDEVPHELPEDLVITRKLAVNSSLTR